MSWSKSILFVCMVALPIGLALLMILNIAFQHETLIWEGDVSTLTRYLR
ncbi:hypothetical protein ACT6QH_08195 [Xanthobacter sp. TB0139]